MFTKPHNDSAFLRHWGVYSLQGEGRQGTCVQHAYSGSDKGQNNPDILRMYIMDGSSVKLVWVKPANSG